MKVSRDAGTSQMLGLAGLVVVTMLAVGAADARAAGSCPNAVQRTGPSAALPDCRAYELVSPDSNHAALNPQSAGGPGGLAAPSGDMMVYNVLDAPDHASSAQAAANYVRAKRDAVTGWTGAGLSPPLAAPITAYFSHSTMALSADLSTTLEATDQPLSGGITPSGKNIFVGRSNGTYRLVTTVGARLFAGLNSYEVQNFSGGTPDFGHVYFQPATAQLQSDPLTGYNTYEWSEDRGLRLIGILPNETPAPSGAVFAGVSNDGRYVAFFADGRLYLRIDDSRTVEVGLSQRTVDPDLNPPVPPAAVRVTASGAKVLFTSKSDLTNDANTGESGGVTSDAGRDLYSYDTATGKLTDLTVDTNPADAATGANLQTVAAATSDGAFIYFTATGDLAEGATLGRTSLYVWHEGRIDFVADADGILTNGGVPASYITPDGRRIAFASTDRLTGYDNTDPITGQPHSVMFKATLGSGIECASCRADDTRPTGDSKLPVSSLGRIRVMSDDGRRMFFHSTDAVVPQAPGDHQQVFEYADGKVSAISRVDGPLATFLDASASGDDAFFATYDTLVPNANGGDGAVFDARVGGGFSPGREDDCRAVACQPSPTPAPALPVVASVTFLGVGNADELTAGPAVSSRVTVSKVKTITGTSGALEVKVPGKGQLTVSGPGLVTKRLSSTKAQTMTLRLSLTGKAAKTLRRSRSLKTKVRVAFSGPGRQTSTATLSVTFKVKARSRRKEP